MSRPHLFLVDDEKFVTDLATAGLRSKGFDVSAVNDPVAALEFLKENKPDLLCSI